MPIADTDALVQSTTESQAELDHAAGPNWREHFDPAKAAGEGKDDKNKTAGAAPNSEEKKGDAATRNEPASEPGKAGAKAGEKKEEDDDDKDLPPGARKRIDKLTARLRSTETALEELRRGSSKDGKTAQPKAAANADPEPKEKDFQSWDEWNAAHNRWTVRDENRKLQAKEAEETAAASAKETYDSHLSRVGEFSAAHDDFEDTVKAAGTFEFSSDAANKAFQLAIVEADNGPEVLYHLAKNPEEMAKFAGLSPVKVQMAIGRLSAKLSPESSAAATEDAAKNAPVTHQSKAPSPTTAVRRSTAAPAINIHDPEAAARMSDDDWIRKRNQEERARKQRRN